MFVLFICVDNYMGIFIYIDTTKKIIYGVFILISSETIGGDSFTNYMDNSNFLLCKSNDILFWNMLTYGVTFMTNEF